MDFDYTLENSKTIDRWADEGWEWSIPITHEVYEKASKGEWNVGLTPTYLSALFKKESGQNFTDYVTTLRITRAKELLCCTKKLISEIAYEVGFRDYRYFSQIFKKQTGMTPRQFQNSTNELYRAE